VLIGLVDKPEMIITAINAWDQSAFLLTPLMCRQILGSGNKDHDSLLLPRVRALFVGAAPLYPHEKRDFVKRLTPNIYEVYGNAATGFISALRPDEIAQKADTVGRIAPGIAVDIVDRQGRPVAPGSTGHIRCRGSGISQRFHNTGGEPSGPEGIREGAYFPGDLGAIDDEGFLHLRGRVSDVVRRRGVDIFPEEIEAVLAAHPDVAEAAAFGVLTTGNEEQVIAVVVPRGKADLDVIAKHIREHLRPEKHPNQLFWAEAIPKTGPGKIDRPTLRASFVKLLQAGSATNTQSSAPSSGTVN
jgi:long-chain acyl-CoA synthetase